MDAFIPSLFLWLHESFQRVYHVPVMEQKVVILINEARASLVRSLPSWRRSCSQEREKAD